MTLTIDSPAVAGVIDKLFATEEAQNEELEERVSELAGAQLTFDHDLCEALTDVLLAVDRNVGRFLYTLVRSHKAVNVVEFGTSFGVSALHLAAGLRDNGGGRLVTAEIQQNKAEAARNHLDAAGLGDLVDIRVGDALETLRDVDGPIDLVLLDGWPNVYLPVLKLLEPHLRPGAVVLADDLPQGGPVPPEPLREFYAYVRDPRNGYATVALTLGDGVEYCVRVA
ncbi:O-methyltransferase [Embleya sp. NBC_00896]|uniref:O-methyltransferase n=1 Tax=Embleya sp. NBC_00896 TaxID=2975961 RepID=UPI00386DCAF9|nr:class I SAM-dependent methyltransferase [Embleya sp. NBC_00896]